jgi:uncharacterized Fe-S cluster protein YjdI
MNPACPSLTVATNCWRSGLSITTTPGTLGCSVDGVSEDEIKRYVSDEIIVTFEPALCEHSGECVRGLPEVFDTSRRPWVLPQAARTARVAMQVERCPSRALKHERP